MPRILELKEIEGELWARIPTLGSDDGAVTLWTEGERTEALRRERKRCVFVIEQIDHG